MATVNRSYNLLSKLFHWVSAIIIIGLIVVGQMMENMEGPEKFELMGLHKSFGVFILLVLFARVINRFTNPVDDVAGISAMNAKLAKAGHGLLYLCMILMPVSGILMSQSGGHGVEMFGLALPTFVGESEALGGVAHAVHGLASKALIVLILGHAGAALYHHFVLKDATLKRMTHGS